MRQKFAVVTGAASGIGAKTSEMLRRDGVFVFALDIKEVLDAPLQKGIVCNVSNEASVAAATEAVSSITDRIDSLVAAAGVLCLGSRQKIFELSIREWDGVLAVNLTGCMLTIKHFISMLSRSDCGSIVTISSEQTQRPVAKGAPYIVSKAGIEVLTKLAALELLERKIRVNCIRAATVNTDFLSSFVPEASIRREMCGAMDKKMPFGIISPEAVADLAIYLTSPRSKHITGQIVTVDSGVLL